MNDHHRNAATHKYNARHAPTLEWCAADKSRFDKGRRVFASLTPAEQLAVRIESKPSTLERLGIPPLTEEDEKEYDRLVSGADAAETARLEGEDT